MLLSNSVNGSKLHVIQSAMFLIPPPTVTNNLLPSESGLFHDVVGLVCKLSVTHHYPSGFNRKVPGNLDKQQEGRAETIWLIFRSA